MSPVDRRDGSSVRGVERSLQWLLAVPKALSRLLRSPLKAFQGILKGPYKAPNKETTTNRPHDGSVSSGSFSFIIVHGVGWSFGIIVTPFESLVRAFKSQRQLNHTNYRGGAEGRPPSLLYFIWLWLLKTLTRLLKGVTIMPNDHPIPYYLPIN